MEVTGTMINYYFHCRRQCWLFANRINLEDNSEDVHIGRVLHRIKAQEEKNTEIAIDNIKLDKLTSKYLTEIKKSDADIEAVKWQTLFYLKKLKEKGIKRLGKVEFWEKKKQDKKIVYVELTKETEDRLNTVIVEIGNLIESPEIPTVEEDRKCKKCAYYEYCYL